LRLFNQIRLDHIRGDVFGGVTAAVIALPMALAFGVASGAGAEAGLYGAILVGLFAALFGGSPTLISEPTGPMTVIMTAVIASLIAADPENGLAMAFTVVILAGFFQILFGILKFGKYITLMPYTVISGFMSGIGMILIILQTAPFLGHSTPPGGVIGTLEYVPQLLAEINTNETLLALITLSILLFFPAKIKRFLPPQLVALGVGSAISIMLFSSDEIRRIGEISTGLPQFRMPVFSAEQWQTMLIDALVLGMLGCIDALLTSVIADNLTKQQHNSDKELIGQGVGNVMSGFFGGLPGAGATMGTVVNIQAGGRSALSGITRALVLTIVVVWAAGLTASIPLAVLAGIAMKVGLDIIDWRFIKRAHRISLKGSLIMYGVIGLTVFVDLITAVGIGLFVANVITIRRLSDFQSGEVRTISTADDTSIPLSEHERELLVQLKNRVLLFHLSGQIIFGAAKAITSKNITIGDCYVVIFDLTQVPHLGVSSSLALEESIYENLREERVVLIVGAKGQPLQRLQVLGVIEQLPECHIFEQREAALEYACELVSKKTSSTQKQAHELEQPLVQG